ncbi:hypothetical protein [Pseudomonas sp. NPDC096950]|uniref:hypothetical protein n=1 Tax=Pseudomonas sp. NPDC096950 TaxID=3364485 RepID=UPI00383A08BE
MDINENAPGNIFQKGVTSSTDNETGHDPKKHKSEAPLPADDESPVDEEMLDVDAVNSVSSEHPEAGTISRDDNPDDDTQMNDQDDSDARGVPASDPESGA